MSALGWVKLFAVFAGIAEDVVEAFTAKHPELDSGPPVPAKAAIEARFQATIDGKWPQDSER